MGKIIPNIFKSKQKPKALCWPVQYSHVEACMLGRCDNDLQLSIFFWDKSAWVHTGKVHPHSKPRLLNLDYDPTYTGIGQDEKDYRYVVRAKVYPIPVTKWKETRITKAQLSQALMQAVRQLTPKRLPCDRWTFQLSLDPPHRVVECVAVNWTGNREEDPVRVLIQVDPTPPRSEGMP